MANSPTSSMVLTSVSKNSGIVVKERKVMVKRKDETVKKMTKQSRS
jgi:hypothetical protein